MVKELRRDGVRTKTYTTTTGKNKVGKIMDKGFVYKMMGNPVYLGEIVHKDKVYPGQHQAIIDRDVWDKARQINASNPHVRANSQRREMPAMLRGIIRCEGCNCAMTPYHARKKGKLYRYYTPSGILKTSCELCPVGSIPAGEIETIVLSQLKSIFKTPELIVRVWQKTREQEPNVKESQIREAFKHIDEVWDELFPAEQERIVKLLIQNIIVGKDGVDLRIRATGIGTLISQTPSLPNADPRSDRPRCGGRESKFLAVILPAFYPREWNHIRMTWRNFSPEADIYGSKRLTKYTRGMQRDAIIGNNTYAK